MRTPGSGRVFRRSVQRDGKPVFLPHWYFWFVDASGRKRTRRGFTDRRATEELLRKLLDRTALQSQGLVVANEDQLRVPLCEHVQQFLKHLEARAVTSKHVSMTGTRLKTAFAGMDAVLVSDLRAMTAEEFLLKLRNQGRSKKTINDYIAHLKQFSSWLARTHGWPDALTSLMPLRGKDDIRVRRIALTAEQLKRLFAAPEERGPNKYLENKPHAKPATLEHLRRLGKERVMIYKIGALAGLRPKEIRTLTWSCLRLQNLPPTCTVEARHAKARRQDTIPLNSALAEALRRWQELRAQELGREPLPTEPVVRFPRHLADEQFVKDCRYAGIEIPDPAGGTLDLYAATRHTFCTLLGAAGVAPHKQRLLMRHASLDTTLK